MGKVRIQFEQLARKLEPFLPLARAGRPAIGWIKMIRLSLGMSVSQLAVRLNLSRQRVYDIEKAETEDSLTLKTLKEVAQAMDMKLVYGFVPKDGTLDELLDRKARELATRIVTRTDQTMRLEGQQLTPQQIEKAIEARTALVKDPDAEATVGLNAPVCQTPTKPGC